jgi:hypothetical protein
MLDAGVKRRISRGRIAGLLLLLLFSFLHVILSDAKNPSTAQISGAVIRQFMQPASPVEKLETASKV